MQVGVAQGGSQPTVSLRQALDMAHSRAVSARQAQAQRVRADAERAVADRWWAAAPALALSHRDDSLHGGVGQRETEVAVTVPLWLPGQRAAGMGAAETGAALARAAEGAARLRLAGEVRELAWQLASLQAHLAQAESQTQALQQLAQDVERRVHAGDLARTDGLSAEAERLAAAAAQAEIRQRLTQAQARWLLLTGLTALPDPQESVAEDPAHATAEAHPELQAARHATELARHRLALLRQSRRDAPGLTLGVRQSSAGRGGAAQGSVVVGLRLPFGTDDRNRPLEAAAVSDLDIAQTAEDRLLEQLSSDVAAAREAQRSSLAQLQAEAARAQLLRERATLIEKAFRAGEVSLPELLRALAAASQADGAVARQTAALGLARARLLQALGVLP